MKGSCLCQAVQYEYSGTPEAPLCCHCSQCRKQSGHVFAAGQVHDSNLQVRGEVRWFASSPTAKRGFCPICGSFLFWKAVHADTIQVSLGTLDGDTGVKLTQHVYTAFKGDYYEIADDAEQFATEPKVLSE